LAKSELTLLSRLQIDELHNAIRSGPRVLTDSALTRPSHKTTQVDSTEWTDSILSWPRVKTLEFKSKKNLKIFAAALI